jgi:SAM-dependent methyltransferase
VIANNFLCHMKPPEAEACLRNIARLVRPGGYLLVSGVDLDVKASVARDSGWRPIRRLLEEVHDGDPAVRGDWPWKYWGLEPLSKRRQDWALRYAAVFEVPDAPFSAATARPRADRRIAASRAHTP